MNILLLLVPIALALGALGFGAFIWSLNSGQFDDLDGAAMRILDDDNEKKVTAHPTPISQPAAPSFPLPKNRG